METIKEIAKDKYIRTFNTLKIACLRESDAAVVDWSELKNILRDERSKEARVVMFDWMIYCFFNLNMNPYDVFVCMSIGFHV